MVKYHVTIVWNKYLPTKNIFFKQLVDDIYQSPRFLAISWHSQYNSFTQNSKGLMFLLLFMPLEHPLILKNHVNLFQKQYNSFIKNLFLIRKKRKTLKRVEGAGVLSAPNPPLLSPHHFLYNLLRGILWLNDLLSSVQSFEYLSFEWMFGSRTEVQ